VTYARVSQHRAMVFDSVRNAAYEKAIRQFITPDSVVLDLGAGLGLLGLLAARAGARKVYLVEPESVVRLAAEIARSAGVVDRIEILQGRIEDIELPEPVDLILSVFTGNLLYSEDLLPSLFHARDRWLKPGGRLLPDLAELWLTPVEAPALHDQYVSAWSTTACGFEVGAARRFAANEILWPSRDELHFTPLAYPVLLSRCDLNSADTADCDGNAACRIDVAGSCHGLLASMRIRLGTEWLDTADRTQGLHWSNPLLPLDLPLAVEVDENAEINLQRVCEGDWSWGLAARAGRRRYGESLSRIDLADALRRAAPDFRPILPARSAATRFLLERMDGVHDNAALAAALQQAFPAEFSSAEAARRFVQRLVQRFAQTAVHPQLRRGPLA